METPHDEFKQRLLQDLEQLDSEKWDLMDKLQMNDLARTAILAVIRNPEGPYAA